MRKPPAAFGTPAYVVRPLLFSPVYDKHTLGRSGPGPRVGLLVRYSAGFPTLFLRRRHRPLALGLYLERRRFWHLGLQAVRTFQFFGESKDKEVRAHTMPLRCSEWRRILRRRVSVRGKRRCGNRMSMRPSRMSAHISTVRAPKYGRLGRLTTKDLAGAEP